MMLECLNCGRPGVHSSVAFCPDCNRNYRKERAASPANMPNSIELDRKRKSAPTELAQARLLEIRVEELESEAGHQKILNLEMRERAE